MGRRRTAGRRGLCNGGRGNPDRLRGQDRRGGGHAAQLRDQRFPQHGDAHRPQDPPHCRTALQGGPDRARRALGRHNLLAGNQGLGRALHHPLPAGGRRSRTEMGRQHRHRPARAHHLYRLSGAHFLDQLLGARLVHRHRLSDGLSHRHHRPAPVADIAGAGAAAFLDLAAGAHGGLGRAVAEQGASSTISCSMQAFRRSRSR